jgi:hypothetical protein
MEVCPMETSGKVKIPLWEKVMLVSLAVILSAVVTIFLG